MGPTTPAPVRPGDQKRSARASVRVRILGLVAVFAVFSIGLGSFAAFQLEQTSTQARDRAAAQGSVSTSLGALKDALWGVRDGANLVAAYGTPPTNWEAFTTSFSAYRPLVDGEFMTPALADDAGGLGPGAQDQRSRRDRCEARGRSAGGRRAFGGELAGHGRFRRDQRARRRRGCRRRAGQPQHPDRRRGRRAEGRRHPRERAERERGRQGRQPGHRRRRVDERADRQARRVLRERIAAFTY